MDPVWMHLLVNHIPIIGTALGLLVVVASLIFKNPIVKTTGMVVYIVSALTIYPSNFTGEAAEESVEQIAGVSHDQIHQHEEAAELALTLTSLALVFAALHMFNRPKSESVQRFVLVAYIVAALAATGQSIKTGHEGGLIRRPELGNTPTTLINHEEHGH